MRSLECAAADLESDNLDVVAALNGDDQRVLVEEHVLRGRDIEVTGGDDRRRHGGDAGNILGGSGIHRAAPVRNTVVDVHLGRIGLLGSENLHVDRDMVPVVPQHFIAVERNLVVVLTGGVAVGPRDDELHIRLHRRTGLPRHRIGVERLHVPVAGGGIDRGIDRGDILAGTALAGLGGTRIVQDLVVILRKDDGFAGTVGFRSRQGHRNRLRAERRLAHRIDHIDGHIVLVRNPLRIA